MPKILCIGKGFIGSALEAYDEFDCIHHRQFKPLLLRDYDACVNTAGIVGYGLCKKTDNDTTYLANVSFALHIKAACVATNTILFQPSTTGMYTPQSCPKLEGFIMPTETSPTKAYNVYVQSKLAMERVLDGCYILRMPLVFETSFNKPQWSYVQDTYLSVLYTDDFRSYLLDFIRIKPEYGIYNMDSEIIYLPDKFKSLEVKRHYNADMTSALPIDCSKLQSIYKEDTK